MKLLESRARAPNLRGHLTRLYVIVLPAGLLLLPTCIQRDNPWDPANGCHPEIRQTIQGRAIPVIDSSMTRVFHLGREAGSAEKALERVRETNQTIEQSNQVTIRRNDSLIELNQRIHDSNLVQNKCGPMLSKRVLFALTPLVTADSVGLVLSDCKASVSVESLKITSAILSADRKCAPQGIFTGGFKDSLNRTLDSVSADIDTRLRRLLSYNDSVRLVSAGLIQEQNGIINGYNQSVRHYTDSLLAIARACRNIIRDPDTLERAVFNAVAGDTLVLDSGIFRISIRFGASGTENRPIVVEGSPLMTTVLESTDVFLSGRHHIRFSNIVFRKSASSGVKLEYSSSNITFERCIFSDNPRYGLDATESDVELRNCILFRNGQCGIRFQSTSSAQNTLTLTNVLISHNRLHGIEAITPIMRIRNATISDNGSSGIRLEVAQGLIDISNSILSFNGAYGINRDRVESDASSLLSVVTSNFFGNTTGNIFVTDTSLFNFTLITYDPVFVDRDSDNYSLEQRSQLFRLEQEGVVIGYRPFF